MTEQTYRFDKPIIILAAPRSGSTLLFEVLTKCKSVWTIGDESHGVFESISALNPAYGQCNSNRLEQHHANENITDMIRGSFFRNLRDRDGTPFNDPVTKPRMLEKTPKNSLRVPFLNEVFPDAYYIFLYRNPRENISSIMEGWDSGYFVTYPNLEGWNTPWSYLLPQGWEKQKGKPLHEIAAFQWRTTNKTIMSDLEALIPKDRYTSISYSELVENTSEAIQRLCEFCNIEFDSVLGQTCNAKLEVSKYALTAPSKTKWHKHAAQLQKVLPSLSNTLKKMRQFAHKASDKDFDIQIDKKLFGSQNLSGNTDKSTTIEVTGRNKPCPCGSGKKYKHCHGKV